MQVLLLGGTGNLGLRLIPALLAHGHIVTTYVRSVEKLRSLISPALFEKISVYVGDALDSSEVEHAIRQHDCDAVMNTAGESDRTHGSFSIQKGMVNYNRQYRLGRRAGSGKDSDFGVLSSNSGGQRSRTASPSMDHWRLRIAGSPELGRMEDP